MTFFRQEILNLPTGNLIILLVIILGLYLMAKLTRLEEDFHARQLKRQELLLRSGQKRTIN